MNKNKTKFLVVAFMALFTLVSCTSKETEETPVVDTPANEVAAPVDENMNNETPVEDAAPIEEAVTPTNEAEVVTPSSEEMNTGSTSN